MLDAWDVHRLIDLTRGMSVAEPPAIGESASVSWTDCRDQGARVRNVVEHVRLVVAADRHYPVMLGPDRRMMDGMHRITRTHLKDRSRPPVED